MSILRRLLSIFLVAVIIVNVGSTNIYADDKIHISFRIEGSHGSLEERYYGMGNQTSFEFESELGNQNCYFINGYTVNVANYDDYICIIDPIPDDGYVFDKWTIDGVNPHECYVFNEKDVEFVAHFVKDVTLYWGLGVDDLSEFDLYDETKYTLFISQQKDNINNYEELLNYIYHDEEWGDWPNPLAGETSFKAEDEIMGIGLSQIMNKVNRVETVGVIEVISTNYWFSNVCADSLCDTIEFDLSGLKNVEDISYMFEGYFCSEKIKISNLDTSRIKDMRGVFDNIGVQEIDISCFDTSSVLDVSRMFQYAENLKSVIFGDKFDTGNVLLFNNMFKYCSEFEFIDISFFDTSSAVDMSGMFEGCLNLKELDLNNFNTSNVTNMEAMFNDCPSLEKLEIGLFDTSKVTGYRNMFSGCLSLKELDLTGFDITNQDDCDLGYMFSDVYSLETIYASDNFDVSGQRKYAFFGSLEDPPSGYCYSLVGENGSYIGPLGDDEYHAKDIEDNNSMYHLYGKDSVSTIFGRIDDPANEKPGYFTRGYSVIYDLENGKKKKVTGKKGLTITLPKLEKDYYVFVGWSDGTNLYTDEYTLTDECINLTPVWKDDIKVETFIDNLIYNGKAQYALPNVLIDSQETYYCVSYERKNSNQSSIDCIQVGEYIAHIVLNDTAINEGYVFVLENGERSYELSIEFKIDKCPLNININSLKVYLNNTIPSLTYTSKGLIEGHTINLKLVCDANTKTIGKYPINVDGQVIVYDENKNDVTCNYQINVNNGELSVVKYTPYIPPQTGIK